MDVTGWMERAGVEVGGVVAVMMMGGALSGMGSGLGQYVESIRSLTEPATRVMEVTRPRSLLSVQNSGNGVPQRVLMSIIWPPTAGLTVSEAGAMRTQEDLPSSVRAMRCKALDLSYGALVSTRRKISMWRVVMRTMMSFSLSSERVLTFSSATRRLPVGPGPVTRRECGEEERVTLLRMVSGVGSGTGDGARSRSW